jgi:ketosteroid isomerase-like protein
MASCKTDILSVVALTPYLPGSKWTVTPLQPDGSERADATAQFTCIWSKESGSWKLVRVISYNHH